MLKKLLYWIIEQITFIHNYILSLNDTRISALSDKELHFLVIGLLGIALIICLYPLFRYLAKRQHYMTITWIYVFTLIIVITFAIEIGQRITHTGAMEFVDIIAGIFGFLAMYLVFIALIAVVKSIYRFCKNKTASK